MTDVAEQIARAVLYEGHLLYPYRRSALKNRQPWSFGTLAPYGCTGDGDPSQFQAECLARVTAEAKFDIVVRFLHLSHSHAAGGQYGPGVERNASAQNLLLPNLLSRPVTIPFRIAESEHDGLNWLALSGEVEISAETISQVQAIRIRVVTRNTTVIAPNATRDEALLCSLVSAHAALTIRNGEFVSLLDPPPDLVGAASQCRNLGVYPVLVGQPTDHSQVLASPVILYDYPKIAPESIGDFFDATEIDEMLALRVLTLTDDEKREMLASGDDARAILERTEAMPPEQLLKVHGVLRGVRKAGGMS